MQLVLISDYGVEVVMLPMKMDKVITSHTFKIKLLIALVLQKSC